MKILIFVNTLGIGGVEWNSIELGAMLRDVHGHDVVLFGTPGKMVNLAEKKRIRFLPAPAPMTHPSPVRMARLCTVVRHERPDLIQAWDYRAGLDTFYSAHLIMRIPMHLSHGNMQIERVLPKAVPTTFMTPHLVDQASAAGRKPVGLILPPVDVHLNAPGAVDPAEFRRLHGLKPDEVNIVTVSRLANVMKGESLRRSVDAVRVLGRRLPLKFVIVGDGNARRELERQAAAANAELGRKAVLLVGSMLDPRPAYAAADFVIGMGGSSLRAMAFGKPVIIVGKGGFSAPFTPATSESFHYNGMYGVADGTTTNDELMRNICDLTERRGELAMLGEFSRQFVLRDYSLEAVSAKLSAFSYRAVAEAPSRMSGLIDGLRTGGVVLGGAVIPDLVRRQFRREIRGRRPV